MQYFAKIPSLSAMYAGQSDADVDRFCRRSVSCALQAGELAAGALTIGALPAGALVGVGVLELHADINIATATQLRNRTPLDCFTPKLLPIASYPVNEGRETRNDAN
jgi:hypothetical protein